MVCAGLIVAGSVVGYPVSSGFWIVITLGVLVWTVAATRWRGCGSVLAHAATIVLLVAVLVWSFRRDDPDNLGVLLVVVGVAVTGGLLVGRQRRGEARARASSARAASACWARPPTTPFALSASWSLASSTTSSRTPSA